MFDTTRVIAVLAFLTACSSQGTYSTWDGDTSYRLPGPGAGGTTAYVPGPFSRCDRYDFICAGDPKGRTVAWNGDRSLPGSVPRDASRCVSIARQTGEMSECCTPLYACEPENDVQWCEAGKTYMLNCVPDDGIAKLRTCVPAPELQVMYPALCCALQ